MGNGEIELAMEQIDVTKYGGHQTALVSLLESQCLFKQ